MDNFAQQWSYTSMTQPMESGIDRLNALQAVTAQAETLSRRLDVLVAQNTRSVEQFCDYCADNHPSHQCSISYEPVQYGGEFFNDYAYPNYYQQDWGYHPDDTWSYSQQDQYDAPNPMYPPEFSCPPPLPQEEDPENSRMEELLSKFIRYMANNDELVQSQAAAIKSLESQMGQMFEALSNCPPTTRPCDMDSETDGAPEPNLHLDELQEIEMGETSGIKDNTVGGELLLRCNEEEPFVLVPQVLSPPTFKYPIRFAKPCPIGSHLVGKARFEFRATTNEEPWSVEEKIEEEPLVCESFQCPSMITATREEAPSFLSLELGNLPTNSKLGDLYFRAITDGDLPKNELIKTDGGFLKYRRGIG